MEDLGINPEFWKARRVLLTGHTGFKGAWLSLWLHRLGAEVHGLALEPPSHPSLFALANIQALLASDTRSDIRQMDEVLACIQRAQPEIIFHLAAQPLVSYSYREPIETYGVNVMGTIHVLEAARRIESVRSILVISTDKCYENREWVYPYREIDPLGGYDPYSSSKACTELVSAAYRSSFFGEKVGLATARAGNVIGGGDWAKDRLIPDCIRAFIAGQTLKLRYPHAIRPWQHVLEPLGGYLKLASALAKEGPEQFGEAWNFGPDISDSATVVEVASAVARRWGGKIEIGTENPRVHEAGLLHLDSSKARLKLDWSPKWSLERAIDATVDWYRAWSAGADVQAVSLEQIAAFERGTSHE